MPSLSHRRPVVLGAVVLWAVVSTVVVTACGGSGGPTGTGRGQGRRVEVVAGENFWGSLATQVGGIHAEVVSLITNPDTDPHEYEPTADDGRTVAQAQFVIENGLGYDPWLGKLVAANETPGQHLLDVGHLLGLADGANPHRWYFPADVTRVIDQITRTFQALDPADAAYFGHQRTVLEGPALAPYHRLLATIRARYAGRPVGASESIFVGLAQATGLDLTTPPGYLRAISEGSDPTAGDKATVDRQIDQRRITVFVVNSQNATPDIQALVAAAARRHLPVVRITETLAPAGATFEQWQVAQLTRLLHALAAATGR